MFLHSLIISLFWRLSHCPTPSSLPTLQMNAPPKVRYAEVDPASGQEAEPSKPFELLEIPRSREVGQSYVTSVWTTLRAQMYALALVWHVKPQVRDRMSL